MQQTAGFGLTLTQSKTNSIEVEWRVHNLILYSCWFLVILMILVWLKLSSLCCVSLSVWCHSLILLGLLLGIRTRSVLPFCR